MSHVKSSVQTGSKRRIIICAGTGCVSSGALKVHGALLKKLSERNMDIDVKLAPESQNLHLSKSGCQGFCQMGPLVTVLPDNILYCKVTTSDVDDIVEQTILKGEVVQRLTYLDPATNKHCTSYDEIPFYTRQTRFVLKECGWIDPESLNEYIATGGYGGAIKAFLEMTPEEICREVIASGLRGRGGGGFPTGRKWEIARMQPAEKKYVICNGDEGDPGAFMNRSVMEGNPHAVIEGLMIAARAIGSDEVYVYVRAEYPLAVKRMNMAVEDAEAAGILGNNIFGTGKRMKCTILPSAGAFVCGEETAMLASIEGLRGTPVPKPPFPAQCGLRGKPTIINNVETLAQIPRILLAGAQSFKKMGTPASPGTKTFALTGHVVNTGLIEVPFGTTLREIVFSIGGGVTTDEGTPTDGMFKAVQVGGPSGGCLPPELLDMPLDFDSLLSAGAMVGSGGLVVMNQQTCMVSVARFFMEFTQRESCGKCVLCREGTRQLLVLLDDVIEGRATLQTLDIMELLAKSIKLGSLCGLGKTAPNAVLSTLKYFRAEFESHVVDKQCPTGQCSLLTKPDRVTA
ncbi:(2Fe-2S) ferredoxin domain-containing protein [Pelobacter propionicus]|uniref:NADH dehydrogenase (Quinone) n=1 Tax=Pelobacter propionicus (strain DSM 2379 / NBRC 103807 / OttBd1) TaxID=338966 RepID=A1AP35_PELPD|nr:NADH-ubiquinone oxidoreductase-F iron-sulfur binding region domain-containing protein [Pelobacter propionicus]ABK99105.1 NADH dehydrogenase (quinone) [Pelobacter propionicus DSM 2379]